MSEPRKVTFIGLGIMGFPMAGHLVSAGHDVTVYNRTAAKADAWAGRYGGGSASTPAKASEGADMIFLCVGNDDDVRSVLLSEDGVLQQAKSGSLVIDHTTTSASLAREMKSICESEQIGFLDAPISGGQAGAENGILTVMCGGEKPSFDQAQPVIEAYSRLCTLIGPSGSGQLTKMVNQICIAGLLQGLAEALDFGRRSGLDLNLVLDTIGKGAAGSWQMENRGSTMVKDDFDFGFAVDLMRKDLGIVMEEAQKIGATVEVTEIVDRFYGDIQRSGGGRWDTSSLISRLR